MLIFIAALLLCFAVGTMLADGNGLGAVTALTAAVLTYFYLKESINVCL